MSEQLQPSHPESLYGHIYKQIDGALELFARQDILVAEDIDIFKRHAGIVADQPLQARGELQSKFRVCEALSGKLRTQLDMEENLSRRSPVRPPVEVVRLFYGLVGSRRDGMVPLPRDEVVRRYLKEYDDQRIAYARQGVFHNIPQPDLSKISVDNMIAGVLTWLTSETYFQAGGGVECQDRL
jgi:hypothetical protein